MCSADARADRLIERLTAAGFAPRKSHRDKCVVVETEVPRSLPAEAWRELYEVLATVGSWGGTWGLVTRRDGLTAHASIRENPATRQGCPGARTSTVGS